MQGSLLLYGIGLSNAIFYNPVHIPQLALSLLAPLISWEPHLNLTSPSVFSCAHGDVYIDLGWLDQFENRRPAWITTGVCKLRGVPDFFLVLLCGNLTTLWNITMFHSKSSNSMDHFPWLGWTASLGISNCTPISLDSHDIPIVIFPRYSSYGWFDWHISWHAKELPIEAEVQPESHWRFLGKWPDLVSNIDDWTKRYTATYRPYNNNCAYIGYIQNIYI